MKTSFLQSAMWISVAAAVSVGTSGPAPSCHPDGNADVRAMKTSEPEKWPPEVTVPAVTQTTELGKGRQRTTVLFKGIPITQIYPSMRGPWTRHYIKLFPDRENPYAWVTRYRAEVLDGVTGKASQEFMCHTNMDLVGAQGTPRAFQYIKSQLSISQGQKEVVFPKGFALKMDNRPDVETDINVMVLNNNYPSIDKKLDFKVTVDYVDSLTAQKEKLTPLFESAASISCPTEEDPLNQGDTLCTPASAFLVGGGPGKRTGHWRVPPGRQELKQRLVKGLGLPYETTVHYIWMHVHPYAESIELRDQTTGRTVWKGKVQNDRTKAAVVETDRYVSSDGLLIQRDHDYELISVYNNPTTKDADAMAALWMYFKEKENTPL